MKKMILRKQLSLIIRTAGSVLFLAALLLLPQAPLKAQTTGPKLWITWRAATYVPPGYEGRALPVPGADLVASIDAIESGRAADLSRETIYWYLNDRLLQRGQGISRITFPVPNGTGQGVISLRVALPNYKNGVAKTITIPVQDPEIVIEAPSPENIVTTKTFRVKAVPYYFNVYEAGDLNLSWTVNGQAPRVYQDPFLLEVSLGDNPASGFRIPLSVRAENPNRSFEFAVGQRNITYKP